MKYLGGGHDEREDRIARKISDRSEDKGGQSSTGYVSFMMPFIDSFMIHLRG